MFRTLRRIYIACCWLALLAVIALLYHHRALFHPLVDLVQAMRIQEGFQQTEAGELSGTVTRVQDGDTFQLRTGSDKMYTIRMTGLDAPDLPGANREEALRAGASKTNLARLVLSNDVRVVLTYSNDARSGLGLVYLQGTNVNALIVESGSAVIRRDYMNGLPLKDRYALIQADRHARARESDTRD